MASNENERLPGRPAGDASSAEAIIRSVRADFAAIDRGVFKGTAAGSLDEHLAETRTAVARLLEMSRG